LVSVSCSAVIDREHGLWSAAECFLSSDTSVDSEVILPHYPESKAVISAYVCQDITQMVFNKFDVNNIS
jgi:hypothetical protein